MLYESVSLAIRTQRPKAIPLLDVLLQKLTFKIKQRPTTDVMIDRGIMVDDHTAKQRALHRRRASSALEAFLQKRPDEESLKQRHIMITPREEMEQKAYQQRSRRQEHLQQRPSLKMLQNKWIGTNHKQNYGANQTANGYITSQLMKSKRRESNSIHDFLLRRPNADQLVKRHILSESPYKCGYGEIADHYIRDKRNKKRILAKLYTKPSRPNISELERRGYLPSEYIAGTTNGNGSDKGKEAKYFDYDFQSAQSQYIRRRKKSAHNLERHLQHRPPMKTLIDRAIIEPMTFVKDGHQYHEQRRNSKLEFRECLNHKLTTRPQIGKVPHRYFVPQPIGFGTMGSSETLRPDFTIKRPKSPNFTISRKKLPQNSGD